MPSRKRRSLLAAAAIAVILLGCSCSGPPEQRFVIHVPANRTVVTSWPSIDGVVLVKAQIRHLGRWWPKRAIGSGTVVRKLGGGKWWVLTCRHCVNFDQLGGDVTGVRLFVNDYRATILRDDPKTDLAVLAVTATLALWHVYPPETAKPALGSRVFSLGQAEVPSVAAASGVRKELRVHIQPGFVTSTNHSPFLSSSSCYKRGFSGGPLLDTGGRLLGINARSGGPGFSYAVPIRNAVLIGEFLWPPTPAPATQPSVGSH